RFDGSAGSVSGISGCFIRESLTLTGFVDVFADRFAQGSVSSGDRESLTLTGFVDVFADRFAQGERFSSVERFRGLGSAGSSGSADHGQRVQRPQSAGLVKLQ
nr:hypothetical protein [Tanacetum cinerariifolium]